MQQQQHVHEHEQQLERRPLKPPGPTTIVEGIIIMCCCAWLEIIPAKMVLGHPHSMAGVIKCIPQISESRSRV